MDERKQIIADYFKLYVLLNKGNRHKNEKTSLKFEFKVESKDKLIFLALLKDSSSEAKIQLCSLELRDGWNRCGYSSLRHFELFCVRIFEQECHFLKLDPRTRLPNNQEASYLISQFEKGLRSLGL